MGEVLRPREGDRRGLRRHDARPNHRRSPPSDNHWPRGARPDLDRPCRSQQEPPCPRPAAPPPARSVGTLLRWCGIGPSVADRGPLRAPAQGGSLLTSNGLITTARRAGVTSPHRVPPRDGTKGEEEEETRTESRVRFTASNSGRDYQVLVKRGRRLSLCCQISPVRTGSPAQYSALARACRAAVTRGSSAPITSNSSRSRSRAAVRSSPAVRRTASTSRPKASST